MPFVHVQYALTFGAEVTIYNTATSYFTQTFQVRGFGRYSHTYSMQPSLRPGAADPSPAAAAATTCGADGSGPGRPAGDAVRCDQHRVPGVGGMGLRPGLSEVRD